MGRKEERDISCSSKHSWEYTLVPEWVWKRVPFHRTRNGKRLTTKRAATVSWNHQLATVGRSKAMTAWDVGVSILITNSVKVNWPTDNSTSKGRKQTNTRPAGHSSRPRFEGQYLIIRLDVAKNTTECWRREYPISCIMYRHISWINMIIHIHSCSDRLHATWQTVQKSRTSNAPTMCRGRHNGWLGRVLLCPPSWSPPRLPLLDLRVND